MMIPDVLRSFAMSMDYARDLLGDIGEEAMTAQPVAGMNHAAWIAGHLAYSFQMIGGELGLKPWLPSRWAELFGTGSMPEAPATNYPNRSELLNELDRGRRMLADVLSRIDDEALNQPLPDERYRHIFPTPGSAVLHVLTVHTAVHLGQLSAWRRTMRLPPVSNPL